MIYYRTDKISAYQHLFIWNKWGKFRKKAYSHPYVYPDLKQLLTAKLYAKSAF